MASLRARLGTAPLLAMAIGCGEDVTPNPNPTPRPEPDLVTVVFEYRAPTEVPDSILENYRACALLVGRTHMHPSWRDYPVHAMKPAGEMLFVATFDDVPVGRHRIRVSDPNACPLHVTGAVTAHAVFANGVLLTRQVDTPGTGTEPGFGFSVDEDGTTRP